MISPLCRQAYTNEGMIAGPYSEPWPGDSISAECPYSIINHAGDYSQASNVKHFQPM